MDTDSTLKHNFDEEINIESRIKQVAIYFCQIKESRSSIVTFISYCHIIDYKIVLTVVTGNAVGTNKRDRGGRVREVGRGEKRR